MGLFIWFIDFFCIERYFNGEFISKFSFIFSLDYLPELTWVLFFALNLPSNFFDNFYIVNSCVFYLEGIKQTSFMLL